MRLPLVQLGQKPAGRIDESLAGGRLLIGQVALVGASKRVAIEQGPRSYGFQVEPVVERRRAAGQGRRRARAQQLELLRLEVVAGLAGYLQAGGAPGRQRAGVPQARQGRQLEPEQAGSLLEADFVLGLAFEQAERVLVLDPVLEPGAWSPPRSGGRRLAAGARAERSGFADKMKPTHLDSSICSSRPTSRCSQWVRLASLALAENHE